MWESLPPSSGAAPTKHARAAHTAVVYRDQMVVWGGLGVRGPLADTAAMRLRLQQGGRSAGETELSSL